MQSWGALPRRSTGVGVYVPGEERAIRRPVLMTAWWFGGRRRTVCGGDSCWPPEERRAHQRLALALAGEKHGHRRWYSSEESGGRSSALASRTPESIRPVHKIVGRNASWPRPRGSLFGTVASTRCAVPARWGSSPRAHDPNGCRRIYWPRPSTIGCAMMPRPGGHAAAVAAEVDAQSQRSSARRPPELRSSATARP